MSKTQKIWLTISSALFLIPEILWIPVGNFLYEIPQSNKSGGTYPFRENFLTATDNANMLAVVFVIQAIGLIGLFFWFLLNKQKNIYKIGGLFFSIIGLLSIGSALILLYSFRAWR